MTVASIAISIYEDEPVMKTVINRAELQQRLESGVPTTLLEALPEKYYVDGHLPGALQLNHENVLQDAPRLP